MGTRLPHLVYVGRIGRLDACSGSDVSGGHDGHLVKSRARLEPHPLQPAGRRPARARRLRVGVPERWPGPGAGQSDRPRARDSSNPVRRLVRRRGRRRGEPSALALCRTTPSSTKACGRRCSSAFWMRRAPVGARLCQQPDRRPGRGRDRPGRCPAQATSRCRRARCRTASAVISGWRRMSLLRGRGVAGEADRQGESLRPSAEFEAPAGTRALAAPAALVARGLAGMIRCSTASAPPSRRCRRPSSAWPSCCWPTRAASPRLPVVELADRAHVSKPTVVRFCRSVGYDGLADFKLQAGRQRQRRRALRAPRGRRRRQGRRHRRQGHRQRGGGDAALPQRGRRRSASSAPSRP